MPTLIELAEHIGGVWHGNANHAIFCCASLARAGSQDVAYFDNPALQQVLEFTSAGVVILKAEHQALYPGNSIVVAHPLKAMQRVAQLLSVPNPEFSGIDSSAKIHPTAQLGQGVSIGAYTVIGANACLGDGVSIGANSVIDSGVKIGKDSQISHTVVIHSGCFLGKEVVIHAGCVIGSSPFNYEKQQGQWIQGVNAGAVVIDNLVHIGTNSVIDRGSLSDTYLAEGVCIDNLVHIGHDVIVGKNTIISGCATVGAYVQIGSDCIIGGASCIAANVQLTEDVVITGMSTVSKSLGKAGIYSSGTLVHEHSRWRRNAARFRRLDDYIVKLGALERKLINIPDK